MWSSSQPASGAPIAKRQHERQHRQARRRGVDAEIEHGHVGQEHHARFDGADGNRDRPPTTRSCGERNNAGGNTGFAARCSTDHSSGTPIAITRQARPNAHRLQALAPSALVSSWPIPTTTAASTKASSALRRPHRTAALRRGPFSGRSARAARHQREHDGHVDRRTASANSSAAAARRAAGPAGRRRRRLRR